MKEQIELFPFREHSKMFNAFTGAFSNLGKALGRYYCKDYGGTIHYIHEVIKKLEFVIYEIRVKQGMDIELGEDVPKPSDFPEDLKVRKILDRLS